MEYDQILAEKFQGLKLELVYFDNGATSDSMAAYLIFSGLTKKHLKDKGTTALDLSNYVYRNFLSAFQSCPEYHRSGESKDSVAFYISKADFAKMPNLQALCLQAYKDKKGEVIKRYESALYNLQRILITL